MVAKDALAVLEDVVRQPLVVLALERHVQVDVQDVLGAKIVLEVVQMVVQAVRHLVVILVVNLVELGVVVRVQLLVTIAA